MTQYRLQLQKMFEILKKIDALFQYPEEATAFVAQALKSEENSKAFLKSFEKHNIAIDEHIEDLENDLTQWNLKFKADPFLKQFYIKVGERLQAYIDRHDPPQHRAFNERIKKAGVLKPLIEPIEIRRLSYIPEDEIENYRIEIECQFLARQAISDDNWNYQLEDLKTELTNAVSNTKVIKEEYDDFLANKLIFEHLDDANEDIDVFNIPYNQLSNFNKKSEHYLR